MQFQFPLGSWCALRADPPVMGTPAWDPAGNVRIEGNVCALTQGGDAWVPGGENPGHLKAVAAHPTRRGRF